MTTAGFDFYGVGLSVSGSAPAVLAGLERDFAYFLAPPPHPPIEISVHDGDPPWERIPDSIASMVTPNATSYDQGQRRYNDYHREALAIYDFAAEKGELWSRDSDLLYELTYLMALSRVGEIHDRRGIHRVHALGVAVEGRGALILLPEHGGKTTLALELLKRPGVRILSDDTPLLAGGRLRAFPTRMGVRGGVDGIPPVYLRTFHRRKHGTKTLIDLSYFRDRVADEAVPAAVIIGVRSSGVSSRIEAISRTAVFPGVAANLIFGLGLPQVVEYFLRGGVRDKLQKAAIASSRLTSAMRLLARAKCYRLVLGQDLEGAGTAILSVLTR
jgi:hypothetical protein